MVFYQDFLFKEMDVDEFDYPIVELRKSLEDKPLVPLNLNLIQVNENVEIRLKYLVELLDEQSWDSLIDHIKVCKSITIFDDMPLYNKELFKFKEFYLKAYCYYLSKYCVCYYR